MAFRVCVVSGAFAAIPLLAGAQPAAQPSEVVVTASRLTTSPATTPYSVSVIPGSELAGRTDVADALNALSEIYVQTPGGRSGASSIFLRGADPNFTVVLFDGVPLNNPTNNRGGAVNVAGIDASTLERVELVDGPLSSLYGSGALAGVINLVAPGGTRSHQWQGSVGAGSEGYWSAAARWRGPVTMGLGGSISIVVDDDGEQTPDAGFKSRTLTGKLAPFDQEDAGRLIVRINETDAETYPDSSGGPRFATRSSLESREGKEQLLGLSIPAYRGDSVRLDLSASLFNRHDDTVSPGVAGSAVNPMGIPAGTDSSRYRRVAGQGIGRMAVQTWTLGAGMEALRETGSSNGNLDFGGFKVANNFVLTRSAVSGFIEASRTGAEWTFNTGVRVDDVAGLNSRLTARAGVRYFVPGTGFSLRAAAGSGFKAPSFYAIGNPFVGNMNLKPEESMGGEFGITWTGAPGDSVSITLFHTRFKELIDFVPGPPPRLENRNLVVSKGIAAVITHAFTPRLAGSLQTQFAQTQDDATDSQLLNRPQWCVNADLRWQPTYSLGLAVRYRHVDDREDYAIPVGIQRLNAYQVASVEAAWTFMPATTARLIVDNAFDDRYEDALGFPAPGASFRILLSHNF
jgi:outer membrane cobalamin receptor